MVVSGPHSVMAYPWAQPPLRREPSRSFGGGFSIPCATRGIPDETAIGSRLECVAATSTRMLVTAGKDRPIQRAGTWHELRATSARHWPMTHGRDRGAVESANSARHGGECNLPAHHHSSGAG